MYQAVYRSNQALCIKDTRIGELMQKMDCQNAKIDDLTEQVTLQKEQLIVQNEQLGVQKEQLIVQNEQLGVHTQKLDKITQILYRETDNKVVDVIETKKKQELVVLQNKQNPRQCEILRGQTKHLEKQLKRKTNDMTVVGKIDSYKNPINLLNRFGEAIKNTGDDRFKKTSNKIVLKDGHTSDDLMNVFRILDDDKHSVAKEVKKCL